MSLAITIACFLVLIAGLFAVIVERTTERDAAREQLARRSREHAATVPVPLVRHLRVVDDLAALDAEASEYTWPALAREIEHDDLTAIMRAVEED